MCSIYLDNSATTQVHPAVKGAMMPFLSEKWGNPSSSHHLGNEARGAIDQARRSVAELLSCEADEVYFTPCGTYSNNVAILGRARFAEANGLGRHMITTVIEHPSCSGPAGHLESLGWEVTYLPVDAEGLIDPAELKKRIKKSTSIISIMWGNNEIGSIQPIEECAALAKEAGVFFHTDAVQMPGKCDLNLAKVAVDSLSLSLHKFYGPKGIGAHFLRHGANVMPIVFGGGQEKALYPGTESLPYIIAFGKAAEIARVELESSKNHLRRLQQVLTERLLNMEGVRLTGPKDPEKRIPGHVSAIVSGVEGGALVLQADLRGLCISAASACKTGVVQASHILLALGLKESEALGSVRITAGKFNTVEECEEASDIIDKIIHTCRDPIAGMTTPTASGA